MAITSSIRILKSQPNPHLQETFLTGSLALPILKLMVPGGLQYGGHYIVEYDPDSPWYETSLTLTSEALKQGVRTEYHVFTHPPNQIRDDLNRLGLDVTRLEREDNL